MGWIIWTIFAAIIIVGALVASTIGSHTQSRLKNARSTTTRSSNTEFVSGIVKIAGRIIAPVFFVIWLLSTIVATVNTVDNGHVGLIYRFGAITGQRGDGTGGMVIVWPWESVKQANVQVQAIKPPSECYGGKFKGCMEAFTTETQDVFVSATINIHIDPQNIQSLYRTVGPDYVNKLIVPRVSQITKEESVKYNAAEIAPKREDLRKTIASRLTSELSARSIVVDDFLVTNVDFRDEFKASIENKVIAEQNAQAEQNKVAIARAQAQQVAATAQGAADKLTIEAKGQAEANRTISQSLTPELIQFQAVQKLGDNIQIALIPSGQGVILDPTTLLSGAKK